MASGTRIQILPKLTRDVVAAHLTRRHQELSDARPDFARQIPLAMYLRANRPHLMRSDYWRERLS